MNYKLIYKRFFDFGDDEVVLCSNCHKVAVNIHHIFLRSRGGKDNIENLIALCTKCHDRAHFKGNMSKLSPEYLELIQKRKIDDFTNQGK